MFKPSCGNKKGTSKRSKRSKRGEVARVLSLGGQVPQASRHALDSSAARALNLSMNREKPRRDSVGRSLGPGRGAGMGQQGLQRGARVGER